MPTPAHTVRLIQRQTDLDECCVRLGQQRLLALDTEFARTDTYHPRLCLVQLASDETVFCLDALEPLDTEGLWQLLVDARVLKILHAGRQDLEVLQIQYSRLPTSIFDTQIAAALIGYPAQTGYAALVEAELGVRLEKTQTRTDWSRRPLSPQQLEYAADDVVHLLALSEKLRARLAATGRLAWAEADSASLLAPGLYATPAASAWQRLPGVPYLPPPVQARIRRLAAWRENRAAQANRPRGWILSDQAIMAIAQIKPRTVNELATLDGVPAGVVRKSGQAILAELDAADRALASGELIISREPRPAPLDNERLRQLSTALQTVAQNLGISQEILATRTELTALLRGERELRPLQGWRRAVVGDTLLAAL